MTHWNWPLIFITCACVCIWTAVVGLVVGEGWLRVPGLAGVVVFVAFAFLSGRLIGIGSNPQVEGDDPDPFDEIAHLDWDFRIDDRRAA